MKSKRNILANLLAAAAMVMTAVGSTSCNVHEWPEEEHVESQALTLRLEFNTEMPEFVYEYTRAGEVPTTANYIVRAYSVVDGNLKRDNFREFAFTRTLSEGYDCETVVDLLPGDYRIMVWTDLGTGDGSLYYDSQDFADIHVTEPYTGNTDARDAFRGYLDVTVPSVAGETPLSGVVEMSRPLAKYEFVSTGMQDFITRELTRKGARDQKLNLDDYYVVVSYPQFMPSAFNMFTDRPANSLSGVQFRSELSPYGNDEILLGFDYVFVGATEGSVTVRLSVYSKSDGVLVASTPNVSVPLRRSFDTIVKGEFLLSTTSDGVGIDPGYDGEFNIFAPLK